MKGTKFMGMYTQVFASLEIPPENTKTVVLLDTLINGFTNDEIINEMAKEFTHPFFGLPRWENIFYGGTSYFHTDVARFIRKSDHTYDNYELTILSSLKNYANEIDYFFDWISSEIQYNYNELYLGYSLYEEDNIPTTYHAMLNNKNTPDDKKYTVIKRKPLTYEEKPAIINE